MSDSTDRVETAKWKTRGPRSSSPNAKPLRIVREQHSVLRQIELQLTVPGRFTSVAQAMILCRSRRPPSLSLPHVQDCDDDRAHPSLAMAGSCSWQVHVHFHKDTRRFLFEGAISLSIRPLRRSRSRSGGRVYSDGSFRFIAWDHRQENILVLLLGYAVI